MNETSQDLTEVELAGIRWRTSLASQNGGGDCVEAGPLGDGSGRVAVRHSQHPNSHVVVYSASEWAAFTHGVRNGEFDFNN